MKKRKLTTKKNKILKDIEESIKWVKLHQEGKVKGKTIQELLSEF